MNVAFKIIVFSIILNLSVGILATALNFDPSQMGGAWFDGDYAGEFTTELNASLDTTDLQDSNNLIDKILDKVGLGIITKIRAVLDRYMFGLIQVLEGILGGAMGEALSSVVFGGMRVTLIITYSLSIIWLFLGKKLTQND